MSTRSKSSESRTLFQFDRGPVQILNHFSPLNQTEIIRLQILFFALFEVLSLKLSDNDSMKSNLLSQLLLYFLQSSKMLPTSMILSAKSIRQERLFQDYVRNIQEAIQTGMNIIQRPASSSEHPTITSVLEKEYAKALLKTPTSPNINIDIPQPDFQWNIPMALAMNGTIATSDFDNIVIFRYVQEFFEIDKLGKGAFGSVFRARNRLDNRPYAIKKIVFSENTDRTRRQAKAALREVRVLAALAHPHVVQYHCAWIELVPVETRIRKVSASSPSQTKQPMPEPKRQDSLDEVFQFEGQSQSDNQSKSMQKSSTSQEDDSEISVFESIGELNIDQSHSNGDNHSISSSSKSVVQRPTTNNNRDLIPFRKANQSCLTNSKIVLFIQMQLCDTTLYDWLRYRDQDTIGKASETKKNNFYILNDLEQNQCWDIFKQLLLAVEYLHSQSFVHRDIKPRNIFLARDTKNSTSFHVRLGDFGLTTLFESASTPDSPEDFKTDDSSGVGTALYAPPEQLNSHHCIATDKSDSYSLGIVLYELFNVFSTEMERCHCLSDLRIQLKVNEQFRDCYPLESRIIEQLVSMEREKRLNVTELLTIYATEVQQPMKKKLNNKKQMIIAELEKRLRDKDERIQQLELQLEKNKL